MESEQCNEGADNGNREQLEVLKIPKKRNKRIIKQRFSDKQKRALESIFESETKLEPRKKAQLASELGLQPRQVAIWFQNRRARWRSKLIEREYKVLKARYDDLSSQFESLKDERQSLLIQLQELNDQLENKSIKSPSIDANSVARVNDHDQKTAPNITIEPEQETAMLSHDDRNRIYGYSTKDALGYSNISNSEDCSLASINRWSSEFYSNSLLDQSSSISIWSDFWT